MNLLYTLAMFSRWTRGQQASACCDHQACAHIFLYEMPGGEIQLPAVPLPALRTTIASPGNVAVRLAPPKQFDPRERPQHCAHTLASAPELNGQHAREQDDEEEGSCASNPLDLPRSYRKDNVAHLVCMVAELARYLRLSASIRICACRALAARCVGRVRGKFLQGWP